MRKLLTFCILFVLALGSAVAASPLTIDTLRKTESLLPHADWLADPDEHYTIENIASGHIQSRFVSLGKGFPLYAKGPVWLRFTLSKSQSTPYTESNRVCFNLGQLPAGTTTSYVYSGATSLLTHNQWHSEAIQNGESILLPMPGASPMQIFVHFEEAPGLWFHPTISPQKLIKPKALPFDYILPGLLILSISMCFLRGIREKNATLFWSCFLLGLGLIMFFSPTPSLSKPIQFLDAPFFLAPGLAILLIPHIGRMLLHTPTRAPLQDGLLASYSLIGVGLALTPFFPGLNWLTRLTPLWGLLLIPLLPLCLWALSRRTVGALAFSGICFMPAIGSLIALVTLGSPTPPALAPFAVNWGLAVGGIGLAFANFKKVQKDSKEKQQSMNEESKELYERQSMFSDHPQTPPQKLEIMSPAPAQAKSTQEIKQEQSKDKTPFQYPPITEEQLVQPSNPPRSTQEANSTNLELELPSPSPQHATPPTASPVEEKSVTPEAVIKTPAEEPTVSPAQSQQSAPLHVSKTQPNLLVPTEQTSPAPEKPVLEYPALEEIIAAEKYPVQQAPQPKVISLADDSYDQFDYEQFKEQIPLPLPGMPLPRREQTTFMLNALLKEVHALIAPLAQRKNLLFSWYAAPSLPTTLTGDEQRLRQTLLLLLHNAVEATTQGAVQLSVRALSADDPYQLQFSINDSGSTQRTDVGYFHAWELASRTDGTFSVTYSPTHGPLVTFSVRFSAPPSVPASSQKTEKSASAFAPLVLGVTAEQAPEHPPAPSKLTPAVNQKLQVTSLPLHQINPDETSRYTAFVNEFTQSDASQSSLPELKTTTHGQVFANIVLGDMTTSNRRLISYYLQELPVQILNTTRAESSFPNLAKQPNNLFIFDGDSPETETIASLNAIRQAKILQSIPDAKTLVLIGHKKQANRMQQNGSDYTLQKPFSEEALIQAVITALPVLIHTQEHITPELSQQDTSEKTSPPNAEPLPTRPTFPEQAKSELPQPEQSATIEDTASGDESAVPAAISSTNADRPHKGTATTPEQESHCTISAQQIQAQSNLALQNIKTTTIVIPSGEQDQPRIVALPAASQQFIALQATDIHAPLSMRTPVQSQHENTVTAPLRTNSQNKTSFGEPIAVIDDSIHVIKPHSGKPRDEATPKTKVISTTKIAQDPTTQATGTAGDGKGEKTLSPLTDYIITDPVPQKNTIIIAQPTTKKTTAQPSPAEPATENPSATTLDNPVQRPSTAMATGQEQTSETPPTHAPESTIAPAKILPPGMPLMDIDNEAVELSLVPLIPGLLDDLKTTLLEISDSIDNNQLLLTREATGRLAGKAEAFNLTKLGKLARCVERAAEANDLEAVQTLHDDLVLMTQKYIGSLQQSYSAFNR